MVPGRIPRTPNMEEHTGTIVFYLPEKKYGYLRLAQTREEFHFRSKHLRYDLPKAGDLVTFSIRKTSQGYVADDIRRAGLA